MSTRDLDRIRLALLRAIYDAGVTGERTFGELLDAAIDDYVAESVAAALDHDPRRSSPDRRDRA